MNSGTICVAVGFELSLNETFMQKSVVLFIFTIAVVKTFILAALHYYSVMPENSGTEPETQRSR